MITKILKMGLVAFIALTPFFTLTVYAESETPTYMLDITDDNYVQPYWGTSGVRYHENGITLVVFPESASAQWVELEATVSAETIQERGISNFLILANGKVVDFFRPQLMETVEGTSFRSIYRAKPSISELIGTEVNFQVLGVQNAGEGWMDGQSGQYIVAWSNRTETIQMKPLPVIDREGNQLLNMILERLGMLQESMSNQLDQIRIILEQIRQRVTEIRDILEERLQTLTEAVEAIYTPSEEAKNNLNESIDEIVDKMPFDEVIEQIEQMNQAMQNARQSLQEPGSKLTFGNEIYLLYDFDREGNAIPISASKISILDLTEWQEQVLLFRMLIQAMMWIFFFYMLFKWLAPKPKL